MNKKEGIRLTSLDIINKKTNEDKLSMKDYYSSDSRMSLSIEDALHFRILTVVSCKKCKNNYLDQEMDKCNYCWSDLCVNCSKMKSQNGQICCCDCVLNNNCFRIEENIEINFKSILDMDYIHKNISADPLLRDENSLNDSNVGHKRLRSFHKKLSRSTFDTQLLCINCIKCKKVEKIQSCLTCTNSFCRNSYCHSCVYEITSFDSLKSKNKLMINKDWICFDCLNNNNLYSLQEKSLSTEEKRMLNEKAIPNSTSYALDNSKKVNNKIVEMYYNNSHEKNKKIPNQISTLSYADVFFQNNYGKEVNYAVIKQQCFLCQENMFCVNELLRFRRQNELIKYIKGCFTEKGWCFSYNREYFSANRYNFALFVKSNYERKQISAPFKVVKVFCKLCFLKLINCSDILKMLRLIFTEKKYNTKKSQLKRQRYNNNTNISRNNSQKKKNAKQVDVIQKDNKLELDIKEEKKLSTITSTIKKNINENDIQSNLNKNNFSKQLQGIDKLVQINSQLNLTNPLLNISNESNLSIEAIAQNNCNLIINCFNSIVLLIQQIQNDVTQIDSQRTLHSYDSIFKEVIKKLAVEKKQLDMLFDYQRLNIQHYLDYFKHNLPGELHTLLENQLKVNSSIYSGYQNSFGTIANIICDFTTDINRYYLLIDLLNQFNC